MKLLSITQFNIDRLTRRILTMFNGKSNVGTAVQYGPYGDDSCPVKDSIGTYEYTEMIGKEICTGIMNKNAKASPGEKRLYCTDENGIFMFNIWLTSDGKLLMGNSEAPSEYTNFATKYNETKVDLDALKSTVNNLVSAFNAHTHPTAATGPPSIPTPVPGSIPAIQNSTDFSNIKHDNIKYNE